MVIKRPEAQGYKFAFLSQRVFVRHSLIATDQHLVIASCPADTAGYRYIKKYPGAAK
jgi:hypothetical protein